MAAVQRGRVEERSGEGLPAGGRTGVSTRKSSVARQALRSRRARGVGHEERIRSSSGAHGAGREQEGRRGNGEAGTWSRMRSPTRRASSKSSE